MRAKHNPPKGVRVRQMADDAALIRPTDRIPFLGRPAIRLGAGTAISIAHALVASVLSQQPPGAADRKIAVIL
jgi:hypothetical protein